MRVSGGRALVKVGRAWDPERRWRDELQTGGSLFSHPGKNQDGYRLRGAWGDADKGRNASLMTFDVWGI